MTAFVGRQSVTVIIIKDKMVLANLRDDKDWIWNPDMWSMPGGQADGDETLVEALVREIWEETAQAVSPDQLEPLLNFHYAGINTITTVFRLRPYPDQFVTFECREGVELKWVTVDDVLSGQIRSEVTGKMHDVAPEHLDIFQRMRRCLPS
jgi:8-oxo-dGTP pyrophosphatase MutT (NUDIX family)